MYKNVRLKDLVQWTGGTLSENRAADLLVSSISTDSRTVKKGEVFAAIKGENFDGHDYLIKANSLGAIASIAEKKIEGCGSFILVDNTIQALSKIGQALRQRFKGPVFAVTGSAGKSSTRDMIAVLLGDRTLKAPASFNNLLGVSKTLFLIEESHEKLVLEMGMNALGEIREMCEVFSPTIGLITNIGDAHIGKMGGKEAIYTAKKELFDFLAKSPTAQGIALNVDDPMVERAYRVSGGVHLKTVTYSADGKQADVRILAKSMDPVTCHLKFKVELQGQIKEGTCPIFGLHHSQNIVASIAAVCLMEGAAETVFSRLSAIRPVAHRGQIFQLSNGVTCIDESYNSNPSALQSSLASLANVDPKRRRFIVIGDMRELGEFSKSLHEECGKFLVSSHSKLPFRLLTVGTDSKALGEIVGKTHSEVFHVSDHDEALKVVMEKLEPQEVLFIKGSHGVRLDLLVEGLMP